MKKYKIKGNFTLYHLIFFTILISSLIFSPILINTAYAVYSLKERSTNFTIKTGERVSEIFERLSIYGLCSRWTISQIAAKEPFKEYPFVPPPMQSIKRFEGLFTPGNYKFPFTAQNYMLHPYKTTYLIINFLLSRSKKRFKLLHDNGKLSIYQQIILASIVEKEAVNHRDYCKIASVFYNRIRSKMPLASCPTLEYALGYHRPFLTRSDTMINSPYNLYRHRGLPPTPIATFSNQALRCVTHPIHTNFYFFVYDWVTGECYFAHSFKEHILNVQRAKINYIKKYGKFSLFKKYPGKFYEP